MKKTIQLLILFMGFYFSANSQTMPTRGEIFDFDINDEFQYREFYDSPWPNVTRYVITDKFYSSANDTVFYGRHFDNYTRTWDFTPPEHMVYYFHSYTDTVFYTNLDTLINAPYSNELNDSCNISTDTLYSASDFCGAYSYEHFRCLGCCFEGRLTRLIYGIGIGQAYYHYNYPSEWYEITRTLFYYKKDTIECGVPDLLTVSVNEPEIVNQITLVYPNPADNVIHFNTGSSVRSRVAIFNSLGLIVLSFNEYLEGPVNISSLDNGLYFLMIENNQGTHTCKFVINHN